MVRWRGGNGGGRDDGGDGNNVNARVCGVATALCGRVSVAVAMVSWFVCVGVDLRCGIGRRCVALCGVARRGVFTISTQL